MPNIWHPKNNQAGIVKKDIKSFTKHNRNPRGLGEWFWVEINKGSKKYMFKGANYIEQQSSARRFTVLVQRLVNSEHRPPIPDAPASIGDEAVTEYFDVDAGDEVTLRIIFGDDTLEFYEILETMTDTGRIMETITLIAETEETEALLEAETLEELIEIILSFVLE